MAWIIGVSTRPGLTVFTRILCGANSTAATFITALRACLLAA